MLARIRKNDTVVVISGKDKGKQGTVLHVAPKSDMVVVKGVGVVTRHVKPRRQGETGGIRKEERSVTLSKVMPICTACKKPCRVQSKSIEKGARARSCHRCKEVF